jgi:hypothetical protein
MLSAHRKAGAPAVPKVVLKVAPKVAARTTLKTAPKTAPLFKHGLILVFERVYDNIKRAIFQSTTPTATDLWYAETLIPNNDDSIIWDDS